MWTRLMTVRSPSLIAQDKAPLRSFWLSAQPSRRSAAEKRRRRHWGPPGRRRTETAFPNRALRDIPTGPQEEDKSREPCPSASTPWAEIKSPEEAVAVRRGAQKSAFTAS